MAGVKDFFQMLRARRFVFICFLIICAFVLLAVLAPLLAPYDPYEIDLKNRMAKPTAEHLLGTDTQGRDMFTRILYGAQSALLIAVASIVVGGIIGIVLGLLAGYYGGWVDFIIMRFTEAMLAIPAIILSMALMMLLEQSIFNIVIAIGISSITGYIRMMRAQVMSIKGRDYVAAGHILGAQNTRIMLRHILPNSLSPMIVTATMNLGNAILTEASLSFLGIGVPTPMAAWGSMVNNGYSCLNTNPLISIVPGVAILIVVLAFNIFGDGLRDILDPRIKNNV